MRTSPHFLTECSLPCVPGVFTGAIIRMISDIRANGGKVYLNNCGKFTLAEDLSDISDMTRIDLSDIRSLEGEPLEKFPGVFFCAPVRIFRNIPNPRCYALCDVEIVSHAHTLNFFLHTSTPTDQLCRPPLSRARHPRET